MRIDHYRKRILGGRGSERMNDLKKARGGRDRLDRVLLVCGAVSSRARGQRLIRAGQVEVDGEIIQDAGRKVDVQARITVMADEPYVSRAGLKLEAGLERFGIDVRGWSCLDVGASTGGFTDCLLQRGAAHVTAVDVGHGQMDPRLREDERVCCVERCNARDLEAGALGRTFDLLVIDVSFISLTKVLGPSLEQLGESGQLVALVKPQFEAGPERVGAGGIVRDEAIRQDCLKKVRAWLEDALGWCVVDAMDSPVEGADGNREFLIWAKRSSR